MTECVGQAHDLKAQVVVPGPAGEDVTLRYWLARCGPEDGETHRVHVEACLAGRWETVLMYAPFGGEEG